MNTMRVCAGYCDDTAEALLKHAGSGRVLTVRPASANGTITTIENGQQVGGYLYHKVFSDGRYVYDPLLNSAAVPLGDWEKLMRALNPGAIIR